MRHAHLYAFLCAAIALSLTVSAEKPAAEQLPNNDGIRAASVRLLILAADSRANDVKNKIGACSITTTIIDATTTVPSVATLQQYDVVFAWSRGPQNTLGAQGSGSGSLWGTNGPAIDANLKSYVDAGGKLMIGATAICNNPDRGLPITLAAYSPMQFTGCDIADTASGSFSLGSTNYLVKDLPAHRIMAGVTTFNPGSRGWRDQGSVIAGNTLVAHYADGFNTPLIAVHSSNRVAVVNFLPPSSDVLSADSWLSYTDGALIMQNTVHFLAGAELDGCAIWSTSSSQCVPRPAGFSCRPSAGACDIAETCNGASTACPVDTFQSSNTVCRGSAGVCDVVEKCTMQWLFGQLPR
eukprot:TRINITY_DN6924_c0_g1_i5.p1 TRINITY_DN6924_c0_g1~~TRINITY_DN6924_c0_g1_i5.p1  ORF type:complete len:353 (+),score=43.65 TRINITY_DN6924_c0_g1_i5:64-1122(+)